MFEHFNKLLSFFQDGKLSAQFEQTMLVTETGVDVLTARPGKPFTPYFMDSWDIRGSAHFGTFSENARKSRPRVIFISTL